jgi:hypothetical protein
MRKILMIGTAALALGILAVALPTGAQARFGADAIAQATAASSAQPVQYYGGYYRPYYAPRYYGGGYYDYYRYGYPGSRDSLNTCSYC